MRHRFPTRVIEPFLPPHPIVSAFRSYNTVHTVCYLQLQVQVFGFRSPSGYLSKINMIEAQQPCCPVQYSTII
jgi:hypothetical protein